MTPEERDIIARFVARVGGAPAGFSGSGQAPALPPIDPEADRFIADQFQSHPEARYRITQLAFVQEAALTEAQNRIKRLEADLAQARSQPAQGGQGRGFFSGLFGGGPQAQPSAPPPQYAPPPQAYPGGYQPGMFQRGGSGFLGSALTTAAGVAGGVLAADAITSMFRGPGLGGGWGGGGFGGPGEVVNETVVNNYGDAAGGDPWAGSGTSDPGNADAWSGSGGGDAQGNDPWAGSGDQGGDQGGGWDDDQSGGTF